MPSGVYIDWSQYHDRIVELSERMNMIKIADELGVDYSALKGYMTRKKIKASGGAILDEGDKELIYSLWCEGLKAKEIAPKFDISVNYTHQIIREMKRANSKGVQ